MKILVTGASGFIGSHLVERLVKEGYSVKALVRKKELIEIPKNKRDSFELLKKLNIESFEKPQIQNSLRRTQRTSSLIHSTSEKLKSLMRFPQELKIPDTFNFKEVEVFGNNGYSKSSIEIVEGELLDIFSLKKAVLNVDIVFHLAAIARPMAIPKEKYFEVNEKGTKNLFETCLGKNIKKIIMMSSISAVGPTRDGIAINEKNECKPVDDYGWSKLAQERVAEEFIKKYALPIVILRPPMVFGPRDFEMLKLFKAVNRRFFPIKGNSECLEFLYVENLVEACILAMKNGKIGEKYHISNGRHYSINEIVDSILKTENKKLFPIKFPNYIFIFGGYIMEFLAKLFGIHPPFKHDTVRWMTEKYWYSDCNKIKKKLGYKPIFSLEEGVKRTVNYYKEKGYL